MKFVVSSTNLLGHLQSIGRIINSKNTMAILDNILFELEGNMLSLTASDLETTAITRFEVDNAEENGKVAINTKMLLDTLREFSEQPLLFEINNENFELIISSENGKYTFIGKNGGEFPQLPSLSAETLELTIPGNSLYNAINKTLFCTADDELRPVMNGIYFDMTGEQLTVVATDAHKLVRLHTNINAQLGTGFILPKKPATLLKNILAKEENDVHISFDSKNIRFALTNYTVVCLQVEGRFPNYNAVIPQNNPRKVIVDRATFTNALKRVSVFANQSSNLIKLNLNNNAIEISAQDIDFSTSAEETINCQYNDEPMNIGFKSTFLIDLLNNISSSDVVMELSDPSRAGLILPFENEENEDLLMLLMPMLLND